MAEGRKYPAEFVSRVKAEFPDAPMLHTCLDACSGYVGSYLRDKRSEIHCRHIVEMIDQGQIQELRTRAIQVDRRQRLYREWEEIVAKMDEAERA
jgi:hypothetical protein